jgi:hypothetical protein
MDDHIERLWVDLTRCTAAIEAASGNSRVFALQEVAHAIHYAEPRHLEHATTILGLTMSAGGNATQSNVVHSDPSATDEPTTTR